MSLRSLDDVFSAVISWPSGVFGKIRPWLDVVSVVFELTWFLCHTQIRESLLALLVLAEETL